MPCTPNCPIESMDRLVPALGVIAVVLAAAVVYDGFTDRSGGAMASGRDVPRYRIDVNHADRHTLQLLPRIGLIVADRMIDERQANGPFVDSEDLIRRVKGIGRKTGPALQPHVRFGHNGRSRSSE